MPPHFLVPRLRGDRPFIHLLAAAYTLPAADVTTLQGVFTDIAESFWGVMVSIAGIIVAFVAIRYGIGFIRGLLKF